MDTPISFAADVLPFLSQYKGQMMWRLDLTSYDQVSANAQLILTRITKPGGPNGLMPPMPFAPLSPDQVATFTAWVNQGCPK